MNTLLKILRGGGEIKADCWIMHAMNDGTITIWMRPSGILGPFEKPTRAGLKRLFDWLDQQPDTMAVKH